MSAVKRQRFMGLLNLNRGAAECALAVARIINSLDFQEPAEPPAAFER